MALNATQEKRWRELKETLHAGKGTPDRIAAWRKEYQTLDAIRRGLPAPAPVNPAPPAFSSTPAAPAPVAPKPVTQPPPAMVQMAQAAAAAKAAPAAPASSAPVATSQVSTKLSSTEERRFETLRTKRMKDLKSLTPSELAEYQALQNKRHGGTARQETGSVPGTGGPSYPDTSGGGSTPPPPPPEQPGDPRILDRKTRIDNVSNAIEADEDVEREQAKQALKYLNPETQTGALGDSRQVVYNPDGTIKEVKDTLSAGQQGIVNADNKISLDARNAAIQQFGAGGFDKPFQPKMNERTVGSDLFGADRQRIEDALFRSMTRNVSREKQDERNREEQILADRGIAINPQDQSYAKSMRDLNERYDDIYANARDRSTILGGQELVNAFGMQEQTIANQYSQGWGGRQNQTAEMAALANFGPGLRTSNFQGIQGTGFNLANPTDIQLALDAYRLNKKQVDANITAMNRKPSGGGAPVDPESPFNN